MDDYSTLLKVSFLTPKNTPVKANEKLIKTITSVATFEISIAGLPITASVLINSKTMPDCAYPL